MNVAGGLVNNSGRTVEFGRVASSVSVATLNLNAGTLLGLGISATAVNIIGPGRANVNFNGGTLQASGASTTFVPTGVTNAVVNGAFGSFAGGAVIDSNGFAITIPAPLIAPTDSGVFPSSVTVATAGSGYIGAPLVRFTGGTSTAAATGYATVDLDPESVTFGQVTGIVVTNPGIYTVAPTGVTLLGGGGTGATISVPTLVANTSGGLTKIGAGTLTLTGANTYSGGTIVNAGTLTVGTGGTLGSTTGTLAVNNPNTGAGTAVVLNLATAVDSTVGSLSGALATPSSANNSATINTQTSRNLTVNQTTAGTFSGVIAGAGSLTLGSLSTNTLTLTGANTYTGTTSVDAGFLIVNGNQSAATGAVSVASGATLGGSGTIGGSASAATIASGGTLTGGNDAGGVPVVGNLGTLTFGGDLTAAAGSIWLVDLVGGVSADRIIVGDVLGIDGSNLAINFGGTFVESQVYAIATYGTSSSGIFNGLSEGAFVDPGNLYRISYGTRGAGGSITLTAVPEPAAFIPLVPFLLAGLWFVRRRRMLQAQPVA